MPRQRTHYRKVARAFPEDFPQRIRPWKADRRRTTRKRPTRLQVGPARPGSPERSPCHEAQRPRAPGLAQPLNPVAVWQLLDRHGISQNELARRCGFSPGHLPMLMNGKRSPLPRALRRLMEVPGVDDFDRLFTIEPQEVGGRRPEATGGAETRKRSPKAGRIRPVFERP